MTGSTTKLIATSTTALGLGAVSIEASIYFVLGFSLGLTVSYVVRVIHKARVER